MTMEGPAACKEQKPGAACTAGGMKGQCTALPFADVGLICMPADFASLVRGELPLALVSRDPMYVPVTVAHEGRTWTNVDMRYKGNFSLLSASATGNGKIPFRLHFRTQRFHGFQELTFSSNGGDDSQLREVLASEVLRDRGVAAARAAVCRVLVNTGAGFEYWGLYTMIEDPSDGAMLESQFGSREGNLYKPDGPGASWTSFNRDGFEKKTNKTFADFSDVESAIAALHAPRRDPAAWRAALEARFDADHFLRWLAVNTVIANWDSYGMFAHNYYLYGDPAAGGRLRWIPWDHNFAFGGVPSFGPPGGVLPGFARGGIPGASPFGGGDVLHRSAGDGWPLISRLLADDVYAARYRAHLQHALGGLLEPGAFERRARELHRMITPAAVGGQGERPTHSTIGSRQAFEGALDGADGLVARLRTRQEAVRSALAGK
jgi:spore coat protein H